jgi:competence protein ComEC
VWRAPLFSLALILTAGIVADRYADLPIGLSLVVAVIGLIAWAVTRTGRSRGLPLVYLADSVAGVGAAYHHWHHSSYRADDIGILASSDPQPARLRGTVDEEPVLIWHPPNDGLQSFARPNPTQTVLRVNRRREREDWLPASGRVRLVIAGQPAEPLHVGDEVEAVGRLVAPPGPFNPGEFDYAAHLRDQQVRSMLLVQKTADGVERLAEGSAWSPAGWLAALRGRGDRAIRDAMPEGQAGVAAALLLGEGAAMSTDEWQQYIRTGVVHVLAISGQHLVILAGFLWFLLRVVGVRPRHGAWLVAIIVIGYALLAGGRPPVLRSAVMVGVACGSLILRRPALTANAFALAWIAVAAVNPGDLFDTGCQLSFLAVAMLYWGTRWLHREPDELSRLIDASRPAWQRGLRGLVRAIGISYAITAVIWLAVAPLVAARYHLVSPVALLIGPPTVLLTTIALLAGFLLLFTSAVAPPLVPLFASVTRLSLAACNGLVGAADRLPLHIYVGDIPEWWLWGFYGGLLGVLWLGPLRLRWRWAMPTGAAWLCVGLIGGAARPATDEFRCTFLAVGHGGCAVLEMPDGRVFLYDAGALAGPDVARRQIAPYLWHRGIRRIDDVFLSHADLDHFNALPGILERFAVGQVSYTPTFAEKSTAGVTVVLDTLARRGVPVRVLRADERLSVGSVTIDVLHPPSQGPDGAENERSLVLLVRHEGHSMLLTGDLEKSGLERVLSQPSPRPDVLMAPHHGSRLANTEALADWARPRLVIACQGPPRGRTAEPYSSRGARFLGTWPHGAITVRSRGEAMTVETFRTGERFRVR